METTFCIDLTDLLQESLNHIRRKGSALYRLTEWRTCIASSNVIALYILLDRNTYGIPVSVQSDAELPGYHILYSCSHNSFH